MRTSTKQSRKSTNAQLITRLHADVKRQRQTAKTLYRLAQESIADAKAITATIKTLAKEQTVLKREIRGPAKPPRPKKADTRSFDTALAAEQLDNISG